MSEYLLDTTTVPRQLPYGVDSRVVWSGVWGKDVIGGEKGRGIVEIHPSPKGTPTPLPGPQPRPHSPALPSMPSRPTPILCTPHPARLYHLT